MIKVTGTLHHASHFAAAERIPLILEKLKKHRARARPSKVFFFFFPFPHLFFFRLHSYKDTLTVIYQRASRSDVLPDILFNFFFYSTFKDRFVQEKTEKKNIQRKCVVCEFVNSYAVLGAPAWKMVAVLTGAKKHSAKRLLTLTLVGPASDLNVASAEHLR